MSPRILRNRQGRQSDPGPVAPEPTEGLPPIPADLASGGRDSALEIRPCASGTAELACGACRRYTPVTSSAGFCTAHKQAVAYAETCPIHRPMRSARRPRDFATPMPLQGTTADQFRELLRRNAEDTLADYGLHTLDDVLREQDERPALAPYRANPFRNRTLEAEQRQREAQRTRANEVTRIRAAGRCSNCAFATPSPRHNTHICGNPFTGEAVVANWHRCGSWEPADNNDRMILELPNLQD